MTAQVREILNYEDKTYHLATEPLSQLLDMMGDEKPAFISTSTACWRGYVGTWEIADGNLYLIELKGRVADIDEYTLDNLFPGEKKVFASWYTGEIRIPDGKLLHYEHMSYMSIYEKDLFLTFEKGVLVSKREIDNTKTFNPEGPTGWDQIAKDLAEYNIKNLKKKKSPPGD